MGQSEPVCAIEVNVVQNLFYVTLRSLPRRRIHVYPIALTQAEFP